MTMTMIGKISPTNLWTNQLDVTWVHYRKHII